MSKTEKIIKDKTKIDEIIRPCTVCRMGFSVKNRAYIVPMNFGYDGGNLYFHTAREGRKIEMIKVNKNVCFEFDTDVQIVNDDKTACKWTCDFKSVIGFGQLCELKTETERIYGLNQIMLQYSGKIWDFNPHVLEKARIWKLTIGTISGKVSGYLSLDLE